MHRIELVNELEKLKEKLEEYKKENEKLKEKLEEYKKDELTGFHKRKSFKKIFEQKTKEKKRENLDLSLSFIDIDGLKKINDNSGHDAGDDCIKKLAISLEKLREIDIKCRWGGDEFVILFPNCNKKEAKKALERISSDSTIPFSYGIVEVIENKIGKAIIRADKEMYKNKNKKKKQPE